MHALVVSQSGALTPLAAARKRLPVVLVQGGIHAGEIDGKDATFWLLRDLLDGNAAPGVLAKQVLLFVPVFNIDGHERFGPWNRPNQRGPAEMGWRVTSHHHNLNREYLKADAPEMRAMHGLINQWDPLAVVDLHVTNGAKFEHDVSIQVEPLHAGDDALRKAGRTFRDGVIAHLAARGSLPLPFYPSFIVGDDPASGVVDGVAPPRLSHGYFWLANRFGMLVETHSWKDYPTRVRVTRNVVESVLNHIARHGKDWLAAARAADEASSQLAGRAVPLTYRATDEKRPIDFRGYAYARTMSDVSGALMTRYDESRPEIWKITVRDTVVPDLTVAAPAAGYIVPPQYVPLVAPLLRSHGVRSTAITQTVASTQTQTFRATRTTFSPRAVEGRLRLAVEGEWKAEPRGILAGSLFVPIDQPKARVVMHILEPRAPDSLLAWGHFNLHFERREYMEAYVAEDVAREMMAREPTVKAAFEERLKADAEFAKSPSARLDFFYQRHSSWDERFNLYPIHRTDVAPQ